MKRAEQLRAQQIELAIRLVWDSLQSHLPYTYEQQECVKCKQKFCKCDNYKFHKKSIEEYANLIHILSNLY